MSGEALRWVLAVVVLAHGVGHVLFMPVLAGAIKLTASDHATLLSRFVGDEPARAAASIVAAVALCAFTAASIGYVAHASWWRSAAVVGAIVSLAVIAAVWDTVPTSPAFFAALFDVLVLAALLVARWPVEDTLPG